MLSSIHRLWEAVRTRVASSRRHRAGPKRDLRRRPALEVLEDRATPTVAFTPNFPGTTEVAPPNSTIDQAHAASLQSPPVVLIFAGNYWQDPNGQGAKDEQAITNAVQSIVSGPYLSKLTQYGSDGLATIGGTTQDANAPALTGGNTPSGSDIQAYVQNEINNNPNIVPPTAGGQQAPIYFIINDPQDSAPAANGTFGYNISDGILHSAYVGATLGNNGQLNLDGFTAVFSHELAEATAPAVHVSDPGNFNAGYQICDNEPESGPGYYYRLNGYQVQAYWSQSDNAFVVPDGNQQTFTLSNVYTGQPTLTVTGGQFGAGTNDQIIIGRSATQPNGLQVTLNGETVQFDPGAIQTINANTAGSQDNVQVNALPAGVALNVNATGQKNTDTVVVGANGSLSGISGTVNVSNASGQTNLTVDASNDPAQNVTVTDHSVAFSQGPTINYQGGVQQNDGSVTGVTGLTVEAPNTFGLSGNTVDVESVPALSSVSVWMNNTDLLTGPASGLITAQHYTPWFFIPLF